MSVRLRGAQAGGKIHTTLSGNLQNEMGKSSLWPDTVKEFFCDLKTFKVLQILHALNLYVIHIWIRRGHGPSQQYETIFWPSAKQMTGVFTSGL